MIRYKLVLVNEKISPEDFARQSGIHISKIRSEMEFLNIKDENLSLENAEILADHCQTIKIINTESDHSKLVSIQKIIGQDHRLPVISIMGHIDHGKTTIIDKIMQTHFVEKEAGGITQNISLYKITHKHRDFFLIDTPGHEIFSDIREFIIKNTDILILIVAIDDGVNAQTQEIIKKSENVTKIICVNKVDKIDRDFQKNLDKIYCKLAELNVVSSEYGGDVITCKVSGKTGEGIDNLIDSVLLQSDFMNFTADFKQEGVGYILDSYQKKGTGIMSRILLKTGTIKTGDKFICQNIEGSIKRIFSNKKQVPQANCTELIDIIGFDEIPHPGSQILVINDENLRKNLSTFLKSHQNKQEQEEHEINFIIKTDNINHLITLSKALSSKGRIIAKSIGEITDSEINIAKSFNGIFVLWGDFSSKSMEILKNNNIKYVHSQIVYSLIESIDLMLQKPKEIKYKTIAKLNVLKIFNIKNSCIAGCKVVDGLVKKGNLCRIIRNNELYTEGKISSMKREKDTISEAPQGSECGIIMNKSIDFLVGDIIEAIEEDTN